MPRPQQAAAVRRVVPSEVAAVTLSEEALLYARVSSSEQEASGFSIPAQQKLLHEYAEKHRFVVIQTFIDVETAKAAGRKQFGEMVKFLQRHKNVKVVLVEKTDRLYRNFQ